VRKERENSKEAKLRNKHTYHLSEVDPIFEGFPVFSAEVSVDAF
jgi:hypothetical protein